MNLSPWKIKYKPDWDKHFRKFDQDVQNQILKKIDQMKQPIRARGLHSSKCQVEEAGQYRIAFENNKQTKTREIHFIGNHKQYEKWYKNQWPTPILIHTPFNTNKYILCLR